MSPLERDGGWKRGLLRYRRKAIYWVSHFDFATCGGYMWRTAIYRRMTVFFTYTQIPEEIGINLNQQMRF